MKYVIAMKSGAKFCFLLTLDKGVTFEKYMQNLFANMNSGSPNNFYVDGGFVININDISAIYPLESVLIEGNNQP